MAKQPTKRHADNVVRAIVMETLSRHCGKEGDRDLLPGGIACQVDLEISGDVDGIAFSEQIDGLLTVSHDQTASSNTGPSVAELLAVVMARMPINVREKLLDTIPADYHADGKLPDVADEIKKSCKRLVERLRTSTSVTKRGTVRFDARPKAAEAATG